jgi:hypothetical protein
VRHGGNADSRSHQCIVHGRAKFEQLVLALCQFLGRPLTLGDLGPRTDLVDVDLVRFPLLDVGAVFRLETFERLEVLPQYVGRLRQAATMAERSIFCRADRAPALVTCRPP